VKRKNGLIRGLRDLGRSLKKWDINQAVTPVTSEKLKKLELLQKQD
jgi:hypothetical protein